jgi:hypothetical protein
VTTADSVSVVGSARLADHRLAVRRLRADYSEMPGLRLTVREAARLVALPCPAVEAALRELEHRHLLVRRPDGRYAPLGS